MKMFDLVSGALALALSGLAVAGTPDAQPATAVPISDGLYATLHAHSGSFVATNAAGKLELARRIEDVRAQALAAYSVDGLQPNEEGVLARLTASAQSLRQEATIKASQSSGGTCGNGNTLHTSAIATNGYNASAFAVNAIDFGPATPTLNYAVAYNDFNSNEVTATGLVAAQTSVSNPGSCISVAEARVTCPGATVAASRSFAYSINRAPACRY